MAVAPRSRRLRRVSGLCVAFVRVYRRAGGAKDLATQLQVNRVECRHADLFSIRQMPPISPLPNALARLHAVTSGEGAKVMRC